MPTAFMLTDSAFPRFTDEQSSGERIEVIYNYLYMLLEQLRYSLSNLDSDNFNAAGLAEIEDSIQEPLEESINAIVERLSDTDGNVASLAMTAQGLTTRMQNAEGNISSLTLTASSLTSRITGAEGSISEITQTLNGLTFEVSNGSTSSTLRLLAGDTELTSARIRFTGVVTFSDLEDEGATVINGSNIQTGAITAIDIDSCTITSSLIKTVLDVDGSVSGATEFYYIDELNLAGGIRLDDTGAGTEDEGKYRMFIYTNEVRGVGFGLKLESAGSMSLESAGVLYMTAAERITIESDLLKLRGGVRIYSYDESYYTFKDSGIYFNGVKVVDTGYSDPE